jgi:tRNA pseudouridine38-40 synthase
VKKEFLYPVRNLKMILSYDGTDYAGWQMQKGKKTIQEVIEGAIHKITSENSRINASGRTDAGVHALGQVTHFKTHSRLPCSDFKRALNSHLPEDIRIVKVEEASAEFHARFWAVQKMYRYRIWLGEDLPVLDRIFLYHHPWKLNVAQMKKAGRCLLGKHDFSSFGVNRGDEGHPKPPNIRCMKKVLIRKKGHELTIDLEADGFLYKMVRSIVGTLLDVGRGRISAEEFKNILAKKDRCQAGQTAPAKGLCLMEVKYRS